MEKRTKTLLLAFIGIVTVLCAFVLIAALKTRRDAKAQLREFQMLSTSNNPTAEFEAFRQRYGSELRSAGCDRFGCHFETNAVANVFLAWLHITPYTEMKTYFTTKGGALETAMLDYRVAPKGERGAIVHVQQGMCAHGCGLRFDVNPHGAAKQSWNGLVEFDTRATPEQRHAAVSLNVGCFTRVGGCKDIVDLMPTIWARNDQGQITSRLRGFSQEVEECHCLAPIAEEFNLNE
jgi:hypothetical protein